MNTYTDQKVKGNADECTAKCMTHFRTKLLQNLTHSPPPPPPPSLSLPSVPGTAACGRGGLVTRNHAKLVEPHIHLKIQLYSYISFTSPSCEMGHNRRVLKIISIAQIIMSAIFLALGMADRYEARFIYTSFLFTPCWIAALVSTLGCEVRTLVLRSVLS